MDEAARLLTLLALAGGALTLVGGAFAYFLDETRRIRRTLTEGLNGAVPQPMLVARGRGMGIGFDLTAGLVVVAWDKGGWRLSYRLDELVGVELIVDRTVAARAFRGEPRRPLDQLAEPEERVRLRFVFDDPAQPDFPLDLWLPEDDGLSGRPDAQEALGEASRWMARIEAILRRPGAAPAKAAVATPIRAPAPPAPLFDDAAAFEDDAEDV
jgi:hypothetical protein